MRIGDLVFVRGHLHSLIDDAVKAGELLLDHNASYTHVALYVGGGRVAEAQGGRCSGEGALSHYESNYDTGETAFSAEERLLILKRAKELYGRRYNWLEIAEIGVKALTGLRVFHKDEERSFICSEYVRDVIRDATGKTLSAKRLCTPVDIAKSPLVTIEANK